MYNRCRARRSRRWTKPSAAPWRSRIRSPGTIRAPSTKVPLRLIRSRIVQPSASVHRSAACSVETVAAPSRSVHQTRPHPISGRRQPTDQPHPHRPRDRQRAHRVLVERASRRRGPLRTTCQGEYSQRRQPPERRGRRGERSAGWREQRGSPRVPAERAFRRGTTAWALVGAQGESPSPYTAAPGIGVGGAVSIGLRDVSASFGARGDGEEGPARRFVWAMQPLPLPTSCRCASARSDFLDGPLWAARGLPWSDKNATTPPVPGAACRGPTGGLDRGTRFTAHTKRGGPGDYGDTHNARSRPRRSRPRRSAPRAIYASQQPTTALSETQPFPSVTPPERDSSSRSFSCPSCLFSGAGAPL